MRFRITNCLALLTLPAFLPAVAALVQGRHWLLDLPACFVVQALGTLTAGAVALAFARRFRLATVWALGALLAAAAVVPAWWNAPQRLAASAAVPARSLRVLAVNLERGGEAHAEAALAAIRERDPDLLFLCELTPAWLAALAQGLTNLPHRFVAADPGYYGTGLFARQPLERAETCTVGSAWAPAIRAVLMAPDGPIGVLGVHTPRPGRGTRCAERDRALAAIPAALLPLPPTRLVLGDFNATPWNGAFGELLAATGLVDAGGDTFVPTWPSNLPWPLRVPIDHVLVTADLGIVEVAAGPAFGSDHLPFGGTLARR